MDGKTVVIVPFNSFQDATQNTSVHLDPEILAFNSFQDATSIICPVLVHLECHFQFLLGCYSTLPAPRPTRSPRLSIPFRMLRPKQQDKGLGAGAFQFLLGCYQTCCLSRRQREPCTFNSFQDATQLKAIYNASLRSLFQFLLGCYGRRWRRATRREDRLSIPFRMLRVDDPIFDVSARSVFQFLLGCYPPPGLKKASRRARLSIPFRMLRNKNPISTAPGYNRLSIPFRMLLRREHKLPHTGGGSFNSFQDATVLMARRQVSQMEVFQFLLGCYLQV